MARAFPLQPRDDGGEAAVRAVGMVMGGLIGGRPCLHAAASTGGIAGNEVGLIGAYTLADGATRKVADIWRAICDWIRRSAATAALPELSGYGLMRDLRAAATLDAGLLCGMQPGGWMTAHGVMRDTLVLRNNPFHW